MTQSIPQTLPCHPSLKIVTHMHTLHMEGGGFSREFAEEDRRPFGIRGADYDQSYSVTVEPLVKLSDALAALSQPMGVGAIPPGMAQLSDGFTHWPQVCDAAYERAFQTSPKAAAALRPAMRSIIQAGISAAPQPQAVQQDMDRPLCGCEKREHCKKLTDCRIKWAMCVAAENIGQKVEIFAPPAPQREPLTDGVIAAIFDATRYDSGCGSRAGLVRAIEAAHGIGTPTGANQ